jgi:glycolate oxidase iron-sulfur subunit
MTEFGFNHLECGSEELLLECVHCGLCLQSCPTYRVLGMEADSPRGRLYLMNSVLRGETPLTKDFVAHMELCLLCRACEDTCPAGVRYGRLMENMRAQIQTLYKRSYLQRAARRIVFRTVFHEQGNLERLFRILRLYQRSHLQNLVTRTGLMSLFPSKIRILEEYMPPVPPNFFAPSKHLVTNPDGAKKHRVGFFSGCVMSVAYPSANDATLRVLSKNGCEVVTPPGQRCCGALHVHNGEVELARDLARANIDAFEEFNVEYIISNAGGCGTSLKEYPELLKHDPQYAEKAEEFSRKVMDMSEFLGSIELNRSFRPVNARVTYQDSCHAVHVRKIRDQPRTLIKGIPGIEFVEMKDADGCCASGGSYWFTNHDLSMQLLDSKMANIAATKADMIVAANPPCLMQLQLGVKRARIDIRVIHLAELLDMAYQAPNESDLQA